MLYHISRNGQMYGPYTLDDLQRYVASGNVLLSDLAKTDEMTEWIPVSQVLGSTATTTPETVSTSGAPPIAEYGPPSQYYPVAGSYSQGSVYPDPPNLHWLLLLLFTVFTCGLFMLIYEFIQALWVKKIVPSSRVVLYFVAMIGLVVLMIVAFFSQFAVMFSAMRHVGNPQRIAGPYFATMVIVYLLSFTLYWFFIEYRFTMRDQLLAHFNEHGPEPIGLKIGAGWTFFFGGLCFQYHFNRINAIKQAARYSAPRPY
jgi:hypothetical protein